MQTVCLLFANELSTWQARWLSKQATDNNTSPPQSNLERVRRLCTTTQQNPHWLQ